MTPLLLDPLLIPLRLWRARARGTFRREAELGAPLGADAFALNFPEGEAAYNAMGVAADGTLLFAIGTKSLDTGARLFALDRGANEVRVVADLDRVLPSTARAIPQGKVHTDLIPINDGALLGATHIGYYDPRSTTERPGSAAGYAPYPGGWFFTIADDRVEPVAQAPPGEGIITMSADAARGRAYALTWPHGRLLTLDLATRSVRDYGAAMNAGEAGSKRDGTWSRICRSLGVDAATGDVFFCDDRGIIKRFDGTSIAAVSTAPRREQWRKVVWHPHERVFYGITWRSSTLFRFDPARGVCDELGTAGDGAQPATLAFALDDRGTTIHALVMGAGVLRARERQLAGTVAHVAYDLASGTKRTSGPIRLHDGRWVTQAQSLVMTRDAFYSLCWVEVPAADRSPHARRIRALRRATPEYRTRGYAEEMMLVRFSDSVSR